MVSEANHLTGGGNVTRSAYEPIAIPARCIFGLREILDHSRSRARASYHSCGTVHPARATFAVFTALRLTKHACDIGPAYQADATPSIMALQRPT
jgi:hypothetical protein